MTADHVSSAARLFAAAGLLSLVCWQVATLAGASRRVVVLLGVVGFVFHVLFGKLYALVPTYFDRTIASVHAPAVHVGLSVTGTVALVGGAVLDAALLTSLGGGLWVAGVGVCLGTIGWTVRGNLTGRETATGEPNAHRRGTDRVANAFVPVAGGYLALGSYELLARTIGLPSLVGRGWMGVSHLLAAGCAALLVFSVGLRLLPRFTASTPPSNAALVVLPAGALGPLLLVTSVPGRPVFLLGAVLEATAVVGFAVVWASLMTATDRDRVGFLGVGAGAASGLAGVGLGLAFAAGWLVPDTSVVVAHLRLNVLGFLGLTVVGVLFQFYPPAVGTFRWNDDRTARVAIVLLAGGLWLEAGGAVTGYSALVTGGRLLGLLGAIVVGTLVWGVFRLHRHRRRQRREEDDSLVR